MSIGSLGIVGGLAGSPLSQTTGAGIERARQDSAQHQRQIESTQKATDAAGIGTTHEEHEASERDADGRMPWERQEAPPDAVGAADASADAGNSPSRSAGVPDPTGDAGGLLDLIG